MTQLSYQEFLENVEAWVLQNETQIGLMWPQKGGWEGWAQASIYANILSHNSTYDILREQHVFVKTKKAADYLLNDSGPVAQKVIVELKAQSFENRGAFVKGLETDVKKLIHDVKPAYSGAALLVVGIYFTAHTKLPPYFSSKVIGNGEVGVCWALDLNG